MTRIEQLRTHPKRAGDDDTNSAGSPLPSSGQTPGDSDGDGISDVPGGAGLPTGSNGQPGGSQGGGVGSQTLGGSNPTAGAGSSSTVTAPPGSGTGAPQAPGDSSNNGAGASTGAGNGGSGSSGSSTVAAGSSGNGSAGGSGGPGSSLTAGFPGSGSGDVNGPGANGRHGLSPAAITAILLAILLVIAILALAGRLLWRRRREGSRRSGVRDLSHLPPMYSDASFTHDPQLAERLRGGLIDPFNGAASAETLPSQYRIEPFAVPPRRPPHVRTPSSTRLLDDAAIMGVARGEKSAQPTLALPRGAMNLSHHGHTYSELADATPVHTPADEDEEMVFELPPTYASLNQPRPLHRRWFQFWQS